MMDKSIRQKLAVLWMSVSVTFALGQRAPDIPVQPPRVQTDPNVMKTAAILGLDLRIQALQAMQKNRASDTAASIDEIDVRQELLEDIQAATLDIAAVIAELSNEQSELGSLRTELQMRRDKKVGHLTTAALLTGSGLGVAAAGTQFDIFSSKTANIGDGIGVGSGVTSTILSLLAAKAQSGPKGAVGQTPNMLAPLLGGTPVLNTFYAPSVMAYLRSVPPDEDPSRGTRLEQLIQVWNQAGRLSSKDPAMHEKQLTALTSSGNPDVKLSIGDLNDRIAMLGDVRSRVSLMNRDLASIAHAFLGAAASRR